MVVRVSAEIELPLCDCNDESEAGLYHLANGLPIKRIYQVQFTRRRILMLFLEEYKPQTRERKD